MTDFVQVSTTAGTADEAHRIATALVERKLAACVQIIPQAHSIYRWQGEVEQAQESLCLIKTRRTLVGQVEAAIRELHSYDCPEIIVVAIESASASYLRWMDEQLSDGN
ncbi:MAG: divalent-cation tolerance protein CutA [Planctomycetota bacterium]